MQPPHASHNAATVLMLSNKELVLHPAGSSDWCAPSESALELPRPGISVEAPTDMSRRDHAPSDTAPALAAGPAA